MMQRPGRRRFLQFFTAYGGALLFGTKSSGAQSTQACAPTRSDSKGPFFVSDMPVVENLNRWGKPGEPMRITGRVTNADKPDQPLAGVKIELWQTDGEGHYHPEGNGPASQYDDRQLDLRGTVLTDDDGRYEVASVVPGEYDPRPRHIHYQLSAPGFRTLVTQIYVSDGEAVPGGHCRSTRVDRSTGAAQIAVPDISMVRK